MKTFLEAMFSSDDREDEDITFGGPLPIETQQDIVSWALFTLSAALVAIGVMEDAGVVTLIGGIVFGILLAKTREAR